MPPTVYVIRNELKPGYQYHCDAVCDAAEAVFPTVKGIDYPGGERIPVSAADAIVLTGSTVGVYERDTRPWISEQEAFIRELVDESVPTLGICFGHQIINSALGGTVEHVGMRTCFTETTFSEDPLFEGVSPVVVTLHGDVVTRCGSGLEVIASADHARIFATRHRNAPMWTIQFHPEITSAHRDRLINDDKFNWEPREHSFNDITADRIFSNFRRQIGQL